METKRFTIPGCPEAGTFASNEEVKSYYNTIRESMLTNSTEEFVANEEKYYAVAAYLGVL